MEHWIVKIANFNLNMDTLITMWFVMALLLVLSYLATRNLTIVPNKLQFIFEGIINYFSDIAKSNMSEKDAQRHLPLLLTLFLFILTANLFGQLPLKLIHLSKGEFASPTNDINMTAAMAIVVSVYYIYWGIRTKKFKFFIENFKIDGIMLAMVDFLELFARPFSLALRLFANIMAGEILVFTFTSMFAYFLPLPFMFFEIFVAFIQALIFTLLATTYIALAIKKE
ncbi:F0F1 ATP synthase subunit A [bacterium]|nr:F0F1 ATP synthase subunit A [bacterium]